MRDDKQAVERAKAALDKIEKAWVETSFEETPCPTCGRVIYCGVRKVCQVVPCGLIKEG
jgi:uncharacterized protein (UPF0212 family)